MKAGKKYSLKKDSLYAIIIYEVIKLKKIISLILTIAIISMSLSAFALFNDIDDETSAWAGEAIDFLSDKEIINGYPDGSFRPDGNVTRAEFAKMLCLSFDGEKDAKAFNDIEGHWAEKYIDSAAAYMYCSEESFSPDTDATRADIAYAVSLALELVVEDEKTGDRFTDFSLVKDQMESAVLAAVENGIIVGYEDSALRPENPVTRAEAAVIIHRALKQNIKEETPEQNPEVLPDPPSDETPSASAEHIYTLYPGSDYLLIESVTKTSLEIKGEEAYRLTYRLANSNEAYSSVIPGDTEVQGIRNSVDDIRPGDVLLMSTAFHGYIGHLYVLASFGDAAPSFDSPYSGEGDYTAAYGKIISVKTSGKAMILTLDDGITEKEVIVLKDTDVNLFSSWVKADKWSLGDTGDLDNDNGDVYVFIRFTNGLSTEIMANNIR